MRALSLFLLTQAFVMAQSAASLSGRVTDPSGAAVTSARVLLTERSSQVRLETQTDNAGVYRFHSLRAADYLIEAQSDGFGVSEARHIHIDGSASADLTLAIARFSTQVQVTAASVAQTVDEQSKALDIVDRQELERREEFSVVEALRVVPGVKVQQLGGPGALTRVIARGMRPTDTSFLIDGYRFRDAASPQGDITAFIGDLLLANTDRIEVLRGSGSSLYGTHATGGVVNVITDHGGGAMRGDATLEGGGLGVFRSAARLSGASPGGRMRFAGGAMHLNVTDGIDHNDRNRNSTGHAFVQWQLSSRSVVTGRVLVADTFAQLNDSPFGLSALPAGDLVRAIPNATFAPASTLR